MASQYQMEKTAEKLAMGWLPGVGPKEQVLILNEVQTGVQITDQETHEYKDCEMIAEVVKELGCCEAGDVYELVEDQVSWSDFIRHVEMLVRVGIVKELKKTSWWSGIQRQTISLVWSGDYAYKD